MSCVFLSCVFPATRRDWWTRKIEGNRARDLQHETALCKLGWNVVTIWECALRKKSDHPWLLKCLPRLIESQPRP